MNIQEIKTLLAIVKQGEYTTTGEGICSRCGARAPQNHPEAHSHRGKCKDMIENAHIARCTLEYHLIEILTLLTEGK